MFVCEHGGTGFFRFIGLKLEDQGKIPGSEFNIAERRHPIHEQNSVQWEFLRQSYVGGNEYIANPDNLFRHKFETENSYKDRQSRAYYYNYCAPLIDTISNHLFKQGVERPFADSANASWLKAVDANRNSIDAFVKKAATQASIYGMVGALVNMPKSTPVEEISKKIGKATRLFDRGKNPVLMLYPPMNIRDWSYDNRGLRWILLNFERRKDENPQEKASVEQIYQLWTRENWQNYDEEGEEISGEGGEHGLSLVPFVWLYNNDVDENGLGESIIKDIAVINRAIYNWCSLLDEILYRQTFSQLVVQGSADDYKFQVMSTNNAWNYPNGANAPQFISPDASQAELIMNQINAAIREIYRIANVKSSERSENRSYKTVVENRYEFDGMNAALKAKARNCEKFEAEIYAISGAWMGKDVLFEGEVKYASEFDTYSLTEDLEDALNILKLNMGERFTSMLKRRIAKKRFPNLTEAQLSELEKDFEKSALAPPALTTRTDEQSSSAPMAMNDSSQSE